MTSAIFLNFAHTNVNSFEIKNCSLSVQICKNFHHFLSEFLDKRKNNRNVQNNDIKILMQSHFTVVSKAISRRTNKSVTQLPCIFTTLYSLKQDTDIRTREI